MQRRPPEIHVECKGPAAVASAQGREHSRYEDRFRLLCNLIPVVARAGRGEVFAVFDGIGGAPEGMKAAQHMADSLLQFYENQQSHAASSAALAALLETANEEIYNWGFIPETNRPLGGCAGTIAWSANNRVCLFHAGDTVAWIRSAERWSRATIAHGRGNVLCRYFGLGPSLRLDVKSHPFDPGDRVLIVSDGVTKVLVDEEVIGIIDKEDRLDLGAERLAHRAQAEGSDDDITVMLFERPEDD